MYLSKLAYLAVKNVLYYNDPNFTYDAFKQGSFDNDVDYALNINNAFAPINEAIARLSDLERIPYIVEEVSANGGIIDLTALTSEKQVKEVIGVGQFGADGIKPLRYKPFGVNKIVVLDPINGGKKLYLEYKEDIPSFSFESIGHTIGIKDDYDEENDIDLYQRYSITESMSNFIVEYVQGKLFEPIAPELANMHITRAETYFNNIKPVFRTIEQARTRVKYAVGENEEDSVRTIIRDVDGNISDIE